MRIIYNKDKEERLRANKAVQASNVAKCGRKLTDVKFMLIEDGLATCWLIHTGMDDECQFMAVESLDKAASLYLHHRPDMILMHTGLSSHDCCLIMEEIHDIDPHAFIAIFNDEDGLGGIIRALKNKAPDFTAARPFDDDTPFI